MGKGGRRQSSVSKEKFHVAVISHGKDSEYMLLYILSHPEKYPLDMVVFVNTGFEFDAVYEVRDRCVEMLAERSVPYKELDISGKFFYCMFQKPVCKQGENFVHRVGYGWCGGACRWGTALKLETLRKFYNRELSEYDVVEYVGIAADEPERVDCDAVKAGKKIYPLVNEGITEAECLLGCYKHGFLWKEDGIYLYEVMDRLSCWLCRNKNLKELKAMCFLLPKYFSRLKQLEKKLFESMRGEGISLPELEKRFRKEGRRQSVYDLFPFPESDVWVG